MAALFSKPKFPKPPEISDPKIEEERRRQLAIRLQGAGRSATLLSGGAGIASPILGSAAAIQGGLV